MIVQKSKTFSLHGLRFLFICYLFSSGLQNGRPRKRQGLQMISAHRHSSSSHHHHGYRSNHGPGTPSVEDSGEVGSIFLPSRFSHAGTWIQTQQTLSSDVGPSPFFFYIYTFVFLFKVLCFVDMPITRCVKQ